MGWCPPCQPLRPTAKAECIAFLGLCLTFLLWAQPHLLGPMLSWSVLH